MSRLSRSEPLQRVTLRLARPVRVGRLALAGEEWIARDDFLAHHDEPARHESLEHGGREPELLGEHLHRGASAQLLEQLVQRALLLRAREDAVAVQERGQLAIDRRDAAGAPAASGLYFLRLEAEGRTITRRVVVSR